MENKEAKLLKIIVETQNNILQDFENLDEAVLEGLQALGDFFNVTRVFVFENIQLSNGELACQALYEWQNVDAPSDTCKKFKYLKYSNLVPNIYDILQSGSIFEKHIREMDSKYAITQYFKELNIKSIILAPIFLNHTLWGFICMECSITEKKWEEYEKDALKFLGSFIASLIIRKKQLEDLEIYTTSLQDKKIELEEQKQLLEDNEERFRSLAKQYKERNRQLELVFDAIEEGYWDWNFKTNSAFFSKRWYEMIGYKPGDLEPTFDGFKHLITPETYDDVIKKLHAHIQDPQKNPFNVHFKIKMKNGGYKWIRSKGRIVEWDINGAPLRMVGTHLDWDDQYHMREKISENIENLGLELSKTKTKLHQKEQLALIGQITGIVAHELRNPLNSISTTCHTIKNKIHKETNIDLEKQLERIDRNLRRCNNIILELFDYAKETEIKLDKINIEAFLEVVLSDITFPDGVQYNLYIHKNKETDTLTIKGDHVRLQSVIINVIQNSIDSFVNTNISDPWIQIHVSSFKKFICISIQNNGPQIPEDILEKIYEPLFSTKNFGVGLGLAIVRKNVNQHNGRIKTINTNNGVKTLIYLPKEQDNE